MRQAKSYKKRRTGRTYFPPEPEDKSNIEKMCVLCKYHPSNIQTEMPSDEDTLKYFYHIGGRDKLMNINLKNKVTFGDRLEEFKQNSASQTEMPSEEENFKWYKLGANDEANELYDPINPEVSFNTRRQLTK